MPATIPAEHDNVLTSAQLDLALQRLECGEIDSALTLSERYGLTLPQDRLDAAVHGYLARTTTLRDVQRLAERASVQLDATALLARGRALQKSGSLMAAWDFLQAGGADQAELATLVTDCAARGYPYAPDQHLALLQAVGTNDDLIRFGEHLLMKRGLGRRAEAEQAFAAAEQPVPPQLILDAAVRSIAHAFPLSAIDDTAEAMDACDSVGASLPVEALETLAQRMLDAGELENALLLLSAAGRRPTEDEYRRCALGALEQSYKPANNVERICRIGGVELPVGEILGSAYKKLEEGSLRDGLALWEIVDASQDRGALIDCARQRAGRLREYESRYGRFNYPGSNLMSDLEAIVQALRAADALEMIRDFSRDYEQSGNRWAAEQLVALASKPASATADDAEEASTQPDEQAPHQPQSSPEAEPEPSEDGSSYAARTRMQLEALRVVHGSRYAHRSHIDAALAALPAPFERTLLARLDPHGNAQKLLAARVVDGKVLPHPRMEQAPMPKQQWDVRSIPVAWGYEVLDDTNKLIAALIATGADRSLARTVLDDAAQFFQRTKYIKPRDSEDGSCSCSFLSNLAVTANMIGMPDLAGSWRWAYCGSYGNERPTETSARAQDHALPASRLLLEKFTLRALLRMGN